MNTAIADIQAAVMAASIGGGNFMQNADVTAEGVSFSNVLAAQKDIVNAAAGNVTANAAADAAAPEEIVLPAETVTVQMTSFEDIAKWLENADDGMLKGLKMLLETVISAMNGSSDGKERKTDLFAVIFDGSSSLADEDENMFLIGSEFMSQIGNVISAETVKDTADEQEGILVQFDKILKKLSGIKPAANDDDEDEITLGAADIIAAMMSVPAEVAEEYVLSDKPEAVEAAAEAMSCPKEIFAEERPEAVPEMEKLYADYTAEICEDVPAEVTLNSPQTVKMTFVSVKINNASDQIRSISGNVTEEDQQPAVNITAENIVPTAEVRYVPEDNAEIPEAEEIFPEAPSVRTQVIENIAEKAFDIKSENGTEELVMVLRPERLGQVAVKLIKENGAVSVLLSAQHPEVGRMMAEKAAELSGSLSDRNIEVKSVEVVEPSNAAEQMGLNFTGQGFERQHEYASGGNNTNYGGTVSADETEIPEETEDISIREAKLWTTA